MSFRWKRSSVLLAVTAAVAVVAASVASAKTSVGPASTAKQQSTLSIMGFGKGDDVAQSRFAIACKRVLQFARLRGDQLLGKCGDDRVLVGEIGIKSWLGDAGGASQGLHAGGPRALGQE